MKSKMLINAVHKEQKRMAIVNEDGKLTEYNISMAFKEPIIGNIYKGVVLKVERGLQAAFVNFSGRKDGFLPLRDVGPGMALEKEDKDGKPAGGKSSLKAGQKVLVQVVREVSERKGALLTTYISLPGRYLVLLPNKESNGVSRKIEDEEDRRRLKDLVSQIKAEEGMGFIVRTAGMNRTKQELARDYQHLSRLWKEIQNKAREAAAPALIYQESDFGVRSLRDYFTTDIEDILVDSPETLKQMRSYCKIVAPRNIKMIKLYKEKIPLFDKFHLEDQINVIYRDRVELKSGGSIVIKATEALITIDVNSGRGSNKRNVEETAFQTNLEAAEEIARQLRLRDLGGLIVIDFIDMMDRKHILEVEKAFKKAMAVDRARIQMSKISKFGLLELSRQKKQSTIQEISYTTCPYCSGAGVRPSLEYTALSAFRRIESDVVKGIYTTCKVTLTQEVAEYLLNKKRGELVKLEQTYDTSVQIAGVHHLAWDKVQIDTVKRIVPAPPRKEPADEEEGEAEKEGPQAAPPEKEAPEKIAETEAETPAAEPARKKPRRRIRHRRKKSGQKVAGNIAADDTQSSFEGAGLPPQGESPAERDYLPDEGKVDWHRYRLDEETERNILPSPGFFDLEED